MCFYIVNLFVLTTVMWYFRKKPKWEYVIGFMDLFVVAAIRHMDIGDDNYSYERIFKSIRNGIITVKKPSSYERGYVFLNQLVSSLHGEIRALLVVVSFLSLIGVFWYVRKNSIYPWISVYYFICIDYYQHGFTIWRQGIAISFALLAYNQLEEKKYIQYFLLAIVAVLFHRSALLVFVPFLVRQIKLTKELLVGLLTAFVVLYGFRNRIVEWAFTLQIKRLTMYIEDMNSGEGYEQLIMYGAMLLYGLFSMMCYYRNVKRGGMERDGALEIQLQQSFVFGILMVGTQLLATYFSLMARAGLYYSVPFVLLLPNYINCYSQKTNRKFFRRILYVAFLLLYIFLMIKNNSVYYTMWHEVRQSY